MFLATHGVLRGVHSASIPYANTYSFELDGISDYFVPALKTGLSFSGDFTLSAWIKTDSVTSNQYIVDTSSSGGTGLGYSFRVRTDGKIRFWSYHASQTGLNSTTALVVDTWYHIACVHRSGVNEIYIDGSLDATKSFSSGHSPSVATTLRIGDSQLLGGYFNGKINNVALYDLDMSTVGGGISDIYNSGVPMDLSTLSQTPVSYYRAESATYSTYWSVDDKGQESNYLESVSMTLSSRVTDTP